MNMWHDTEIEPTSAGVSHSAPAEVEVTMAPNVGLSVSEVSEDYGGVRYDGRRRDTGYMSCDGATRTSWSTLNDSCHSSRHASNVGSQKDVAGGATPSVDGRSPTGAILDGLPRVRWSVDQEGTGTDVMDSGSRWRHVSFSRRGRKDHQSASKSSSRCSSPCADDVRDRPPGTVDRPHGIPDRPLGPVDRPSGTAKRPFGPVARPYGTPDRSRSSGDRPLSVGWDSDDSAKSRRPRRSAMESAVGGREAERHSGPDEHRPASDSESASSSSVEGRDCRRHGCCGDVRESHQRQPRPTTDCASSDVCRRRSRVESSAGGRRSFHDDDRRFGVTDARRKVRHSVLPTLKLGHYDGTTCLETFLAKFDNCSDYYSWDERGRLCHLRAALDGGAGQVLWDAGKQSSVEEIIRLLKNRFGTQNQDERYRAELKARRRRNGEALQAVYHDVRRLMALAFPGQSGSLWEIMARDSFLEALGDSALRLRILEREPSTLDEALKIASRLEALRKTDSEEPWDDLGRRKEKLKVMAAQTDATKQKDEKIRELEKTVQQYKRRLEGYEREESLRQRCTSQAPQMPNTQAAFAPQDVWPVPSFHNYVEGYVDPTAAQGNGANVPNYQQWTVGKPGRRNGGSKTSDTCYACGQRGHYRKNCPSRLSSASCASVGKPGNETYMEIMVSGRKVACLLDTGCERSMLPAKFVPKVPLRPTDVSVYAANGAKIPIKGSVRLRFEVEGMSLEAELLVSDAVDEMMLGIDWLAERGCHWKFDERKIVIAGRQIALQSRPSRVRIRRIYVEQPVVLSPRSITDVPVRMAWNSFRVPPTEWLMEPRQFDTGVYAARTLLPEKETRAAVRVINASQSPYQLGEGACLGGAGPATVIDPESSLAWEVDGPTCTGYGSSCLCGSGRETDRPLWPADRPPRQATRDKEADGTDLDTDDYLQPVVASLPSELSPDERVAAIQLIRENRDVFSKSEFDLGRCDQVQHRIDTGGHRPFKEQLRRHPQVHLDFIDQRVNEMLEANVIEPCASPWSSNVVLAKKADGSLRFCIDYRKLNDVTYKDSYPLPRIDTCLDALGGSTYFSTLDLRSGFWQVAIDPRDADKTAFVTRRGQFRFNVLSFGLANSPSVFQRLMDLILAGLTWETCLVYIDDVIVYSRSFEDHAAKLSIVFQRLRIAGLKLKPTKCRLFQRRVVFLGHVLSDRGTEPDPEKVSAVVDWPIPKTLTEVRSFLGLASYYRSFVQGFSQIAAPLHELTRKGVRFMWTNRQQESFERLKRCLSSAPVLSTPRPEGRYVLDVDASDVGVGAALHQEQDGQLRVIAFASRLFDKAERVYCTTRKELAAVIFGLKRFRQYILGRRLVIRSDHAALSYLRKSKELVAQQARWLDYIEQFDIQVRHRSGTAHRNADALSRRPCEVGRSCSQCRGGKRVQVNQLAGRSALQHNRNFGCQKIVTGQLPSLAREDDRHDDVVRDSDRPLWRADRPLYVRNLQPGLVASKSNEPEDIAHQLAAVQTRQQVRYKREEAERWKVHEDNYRMMAKNFSHVDEPLPSLGREDDHHANVNRDSDRPFWQADRPRRVVSLSPEQIDPQIEQPVAVAETVGETNGDGCSEPIVTVAINDEERWTNEGLKQAQGADPEIRPVVEWLLEAARPEWNNILHASHSTKNYWKQWDSLLLKDGVAYRRFVRPDGVIQYFQLLVPRCLRKELIQLTHVGAAGHLGVGKTRKQVQRRAYWTAWRTDVELFCKHCRPCNQYHRGAVPRQGHLQSMKVGYPSERWQVDLTGPHVPVGGLRYIMTAEDSFTRFIVAVPIRDKSAITVARAFIDHVVLKFGAPMSVLTDLGTEFQNELWSEMFRLFGIQRLKTTAWNPSTNGRIERWHRTINSMLGKVVDTRQKDWPERLKFVVMAYNGTVHEATSFSPNFLQFGRELPMPVDLLLGRTTEEPRSVNDYAQHVVDRMTNAYELVREHLGRTAERCKARYDMKVRPVTFEVGSKVWVYCPRRLPGTSAKWTRYYNGPYTIVRRVNDVNYVVQLSPRSRLQIVHVNKLKGCGKFEPTLSH